MGDSAADTGAIREASGGRAHLAFDMVGNASDPNMTLQQALRSLMKGGLSRLDGYKAHDGTALPVPYTELMLERLGDSRTSSCTPATRIGVCST